MKKYLLYILLSLFIAYPAIAQVRPSYHQGFAIRSLSKRPNLWNQLGGCWNPSLGVTGNTLKDFSQFKNDGVFSGASWVIGGNSLVPGYALSFDGVSNNINIGNVTTMTGATKASFWIWFKKTGDGDSFNILFSKDATFEMSVRESSSNDYSLRINNSEINYTGAPTDNVWNFVVMTYNSGVTNGSQLYENGILIDSLTATHGFIGPDATNLVLGGRGTAFSFNGLIGLCGMHRRILLPSEIADMYQYPNAMFEPRDVILVKPPAGAPAARRIIIISQLFKGFEFLYN